MKKTEKIKFTDTLKQIDEIFNKEKIIKKEEKCFEEKDILKKYDNELHNLEFKLQELRGFPKDSSYHISWVHQPCCTCPKMDNDERWGIEGKIINNDCPIHGNK